MPPIPEDLEIELGEFSEYSKEAVDSLKIRERDRRLLSEVGFPSESAPFLTFGQPGQEPFRPISQVIGRLTDEFDNYRLFGGTGSGDPICIDETDGTVVYLNHDLEMKRVFMNSSISQLAETLCLLAEAMHSNRSIEFILELGRIDGAAVGEDTMWSNEHGLDG